MKVAAVILAAGASSRMGSSKALLPLGGATFLERAIRTFAADCDPVIVVLGFGGDDIRAAATGIAHLVLNPQPERGQLSSLQCGFAEVPADADAVTFCPVDFPNVQATTVRALVDALDGNSLVAVPRFSGRHGHPVLVRRNVMDELLALPFTATARDVIHRHSGRTHYVDVDDSGVVLDVDTPEDYHAAGGALEAL